MSLYLIFFSHVKMNCLLEVKGQIQFIGRRQKNNNMDMNGLTLLITHMTHDRLLSFSDSFKIKKGMLWPVLSHE